MTFTLFMRTKGAIGKKRREMLVAAGMLQPLPPAGTKLPCPYPNCAYKCSLSYVCRHLTEKHINACRDKSVFYVPRNLPQSYSSASGNIYDHFQSFLYKYSRWSCWTCGAIPSLPAATCLCSNQFDTLNPLHFRGCDPTNPTIYEEAEVDARAVVAFAEGDASHSGIVGFSQHEIALQVATPDITLGPIDVSPLVPTPPSPSANMIISEPHPDPLIIPPSLGLSSTISADPISSEESLMHVPQLVHHDLLNPFEIFHTIRDISVPVLRFIPKQCHRLWLTCLNHSLQRVISRPNDLEAHAFLQMLPQCVLRSVSSPNHKRKRFDTMAIQRRFTKGCLQRWLVDDQSKWDLWQQCLQTTASKPSYQSSSETGRKKKALGYIACGRFSAATSILQSDGLAAASVENLDIITSKFPVSTTDLPNLPCPQYLQVDDDDVVRGIKSFDALTACGRDGLHADHLKVIFQSVTPGLMSQSIKLMTAYVNLLLSGGIPSELSTFICSAPVYPLNKKDGGIRPIAVGEIWRRLTSKVAMFAVKGDMADLLTPLQCGVAIRSGTDGILHSISQIVDLLGDDGNYALMKVDFSNAFNNINRTQMLEQVRKFSPQLSAYVEFCYGTPSRMYFGEHFFSCSTGVQQGDPLGPLLFSLTLQPLLLDLKAYVPDLVLNAWFLDDGSLIGDIASLSAAWNIIKTKGPLLGLFPNPSKSELFWPTPHPDIAALIPDVPAYLDSGTEILGGCIGSSDFASRSISQKVVKIGQILDLLPLLEHDQSQYLLLKSSLSFARFNHVLRTTPRSKIESCISSFDGLVKSAFQDLIGHTDLSQPQFTQISLSVKSGGFGLRMADDFADICYASSVVQSRGLQQKLSILVSSSLPVHILSSVQTLNGWLPPQHHVSIESLETASKPQHFMSEKMDIILADRLRSQHANRPRELARLQACATQFSSDLLTFLPSYHHNLKNAEWKILMKQRLGIALYDAGRICPKERCDRWCDEMGDHTISCVSEGSATRRHDAIADTLYAIAKEAGFQVHKERLCLASSNGKPGDVEIEKFHLGLDAWIDVRISNSMLNVDQARNTQFYNGSKAESEKISKYAGELEIMNGEIIFQPFVIETMGGFGMKALSIIHGLARNWGSRRFTSSSDAKRTIRHRISAVLARSNADMLLRTLALMS